ncbi:TPA: RadC family protein [Serratia fonticola]|uniref:DNA repair protein RadC n=1 Tax=Serratia fonticola TaxID=47917 RepID=A0A3S4Z3S2_SERFO|nr:DNA repair protein RadC [Serratia fonticola]
MYESIRLKEEKIIQKAQEIVANRLYRPEKLSTLQAVCQFLSLKLALREQETFAVVFLDNQLQVIHYEELFHGTINETSVYPREIAKAALKHNAAKVILSHNHPSGVPEPSLADRNVTERSVKALELLDIQVLDHLVIGGNSSVSFAERGWL